MLLAIILMLAGLILGFLRLLTIFTPRPIPPVFKQYLGLHSSLMIIGFITILIMYERLSGMELMPTGEAKYVVKNALLLTVAGYILYLLLMIMRVAGATWVAIGILFIGGIFFIRYLDLIRERINRNSYNMFLIAVIAYLAYIYFIAAGSRNYTAYSLLILSYPLLFIMAERIELSKFIPHTRKELLNMNPILGALSVVVLIIINLIAYSQATVAPAILLLILVANMYRYEHINIKRLLGMGRWLMKYQAIHLTTAYASAILGLAVYILFTTILNRLPILDTAIHLIALGFIGNMLLGHGPAVLSTIQGKSLDEEGLKLYAYILLNGSLILRVIANIVRTLEVWIPTQLYELSGILVILAVPAFLMMVRKAAK